VARQFRIDARAEPKIEETSFDDIFPLVGLKIPAIVRSRSSCRPIVAEQPDSVAVFQAHRHAVQRANGHDIAGLLRHAPAGRDGDKLMRSDMLLAL